MAKRKPKIDPVTGLEMPIELKPYSFRVQGHGHDLPVGTFEAPDEHQAFTQAFRACSAFELPGWRLRCVETGTSQAVVRLKGFDPVTGQPLVQRV